MLADPQSLSYNSGSVSLPRVSVGNKSATYESADGAFELLVSHQAVKSRERSVVRLNHKKLAADPLDPSTNRPYDMTVQVLLNRPLNVGYTDAEATLVYDALVAFVGGSTFKSKFFGSES